MLELLVEVLLFRVEDKHDAIHISCNRRPARLVLEITAAVPHLNLDIVLFAATASTDRTLELHDSHAARRMVVAPKSLSCIR